MTRSRVLVLGFNYSPEHTGIAPYIAGMARGLSRDYHVQVVITHPHYPEWRIADGYGAWRQDERGAEVAVRPAIAVIALSRRPRVACPWPRGLGNGRREYPCTGNDNRR